MSLKLQRRLIQSWADMPLSAKGLIVVALPLGGLLMVLVSFYFVQRENQAAQKSVQHSLEVRSQIQSVHSSLEEAETGVRGFLLTGRQEWLGDYYEAKEKLPESLGRLARMVADNRGQQETVRRIAALSAEKLQETAALLALRKRSDSMSPEAVALLDRGEAAMDRLREELSGMRSAQEQLLSRRLAAATRVWSRSYLLIAAGMVIAPAGGILAMLLFTAGVGRRVQRLDENAHLLAQGMALPAPAEAHDEIGRLERSLHDASLLLNRRERQLLEARRNLERRVEERTAELAGANEALQAEVAERKRAEEKLRQANETLRAVIDASPLAIVGLDLEGKVTSWNQAAEQMFGWSAEEVLDRPVPSIPDEEMHSFHSVLESTIGGAGVAGMETRRRRKDGALVDARIWTAPVRDATGEISGKIGVLLDVTDRKRLEEQLGQAQKMEAIGRLAGGVAHDFNNLITIISGYGQMVRDGVREDPSLREAAEEVLKASDRAAALAGQLLSFSRRQVIQPKILDLNTLVANVEKMLRRVIGEDLELKTVLRPGLDPVKADPGQLEQVIVNLAVNARDAMPKGGKLTIETANVDVNESYVRGHAGAGTGPHVMLAISDTGEGMNTEVKAHLFEPFFTTKEKGKGTGLGLSTVYGIVKQHGGDIWVYSEPGKGTTFKIYLPAAERAAVATARQPSAPASSAGTETVLVAEDEEGVRKLVCSVLEQRGYKVLEASDGADALRLFDQHATPIDLLVTDIVMPHMSGRDLAEALSLLNPRLKVLFLSGYTDQVLVDSSGLQLGAEFLEKPFTPDVLAEKVRHVLDA